MAQAIDDEEDLILKKDKIKDPSDYKQHRRIKGILDAQERVLQQRRRGLDFYYEGDISRQTYNKIVRQAVEEYLIVSEFTIKDSKWSQWFWEGEPPTTDSDKPWIRVIVDEHEGDDRPTLYCPTADVIEDVFEEYRRAEQDPERHGIDVLDREFLKVDIEMVETRLADQLIKTLRQIERENEAEAAEEDAYAESTAEQDERRSLFTNIFVDPKSKRPPFGVELNSLGVLHMPEIDDAKVFVGLREYLAADDPIRRQGQKETSHPLKRREKTDEVHVYQIPEQVSLRALRLINEFWHRAGMDIEYDQGLPIEKDFDMSGQSGPVEDVDALEYGHTSGSPEI